MAVHTLGINTQVPRHTGILYMLTADPLPADCFKYHDFVMCLHVNQKRDVEEVYISITVTSLRAQWDSCRWDRLSRLWGMRRLPSHGLVWIGEGGHF